MKYIEESELIKFIKAEAHDNKKKRAFISDLYGSGIVFDGKRLTPVFDSVEEILNWNHPEDYFEYQAIDQILSLCSESASLDKTEVIKKLQNTSYFGDFFKSMKEALDSIKNYFGTRIGTTQRNKMISSAKKVLVDDTVLVRVPNANEGVCDDILYIVSNDELAESVIDILRNDESLSGRESLYYSNLSKQMKNE